MELLTYALIAWMGFSVGVFATVFALWVWFHENYTGVIMLREGDDPVNRRPSAPQPEPEPFSVN